jgi:hypothetical protein
MNRRVIIEGARMSGQLLGYAVRRWVREVLPFLCIFLIVLTAAACVIGFSYYEENVELEKENAYLTEHCMVPIEALEGGYNWTIQ